MRAVHLWSTALGPARLASLFEEASKLGLRVGWLDLTTGADCPALAPAASAGAFRVVAAGGPAVVALKPVAGEPVLKDLVREYFGGCRLVLVVGLTGAPELSDVGGGFRLRYPDGVETDMRAAELAAALRKARPGRSQGPSET